MNNYPENVPEFPEFVDKEAEVKNRVLDCLKNGKIEEVLDIINYNSYNFINFTDVQDAAKVALRTLLESDEDNTRLVIELKREFNLPSEFIQSEEVQNFVKLKLIKDLSKGYICDNDLLHYFSIPNEFINSKEVQVAAKEGFVKMLEAQLLKETSVDWDEVLSFKSIFNLPNEVINSKEVQVAAKEGFIKMFNTPVINWDKALSFIYVLKLPNEFIQSEEVQRNIRSKFIKDLSRGIINENIRNILHQLQVPDEFINSNDVQQQAKNGLIEALNDKKGYSNAITIKRELNLPDEFIKSHIVQETAKQTLFNTISRGDDRGAYKIKKEFDLPEEYCQKVAQEAIIKLLSLDNFFRPTNQANRRLPEEIIRSASSIKERFNISEYDSNLIADKAIEELNKYIESINIEIDKLYKVENSSFYTGQIKKYERILRMIEENFKKSLPDSIE